MTVSNTVAFTANAGSIVIGDKGRFGAAIELVGGDPARSDPLVAAVAQEFILRSSDSATITGATAASPVVVTATAHGFINQDVVHIISVAGMVELNYNLYTVANVTANTFDLKTVPTVAAPSTNVDGTGFTAYTSGGAATLDGIAGSVTISLP